MRVKLMREWNWRSQLCIFYVIWFQFSPAIIIFFTTLGTKLWDVIYETLETEEKNPAIVLGPWDVLMLLMDWSKKTMCNM